MAAKLTAQETIQRARDALAEARTIDPDEFTGNRRGGAVLRKRKHLFAAQRWAQRFVTWQKVPPGTTIALQREAASILEAIEDEWPGPKGR